MVLQMLPSIVLYLTAMPSLGPDPPLPFFFFCECMEGLGPRLAHPIYTSSTYVPEARYVHIGDGQGSSPASQAMAEPLMILGWE